MSALEKSLDGVNLLEQKVFEFVMDDPTIVIDKTHISYLVRQRFSLWIHNTCGSTLYFKLVEQIPNWTLGITSDIPADGKLGAIGAGLTKHFEGQIIRSLPAGESEDVGNFVVEAYPDATYTALIESHSHPTTVYIEDLENWVNVQKFGFDDGTAQGWSLSNMAVSGVKSVESGGYSLFGKTFVTVYEDTKIVYLSKSIVLPATSKVRLSLYWLFQYESGASGGLFDFRLNHLKVYVDDVEVYTCFKPDVPVFDVHESMSDSTTKTYGWFKIGLDLSSFGAETVVIKIEAELYTNAYYAAHTGIYIDNVVIAGK